MPQVGYPGGAGAQVRTDQNGVDGDHMQVWKLAQSSGGSESLVGDIGDQTKGLLIRMSALGFPVAVQPASKSPMRIKISAGVVNTTLQLAAGQFWHITYGFIGGGVVPVLTPPPGKRAYIQGLTLTIRATGLFKLYDTVDTARTTFYSGRPAPGPVTMRYLVPMPQDNVNTGPNTSVIWLNADTVVNGDLVMWGYFR